MLNGRPIKVADVPTPSNLQEAFNDPDYGPCWREAYDSIEMFLCMRDYKKILLRIWFSPIGLPPLLSFNLCNAAAVWAILKAE